MKKINFKLFLWMFLGTLCIDLILFTYDYFVLFDLFTISYSTNIATPLLWLWILYYAAHVLLCGALAWYTGGEWQWRPKAPFKQVFFQWCKHYGPLFFILFFLWIIYTFFPSKWWNLANLIRGRYFNNDKSKVIQIFLLDNVAAPSILLSYFISLVIFFYRRAEVKTVKKQSTEIVKAN